MEVSASRFVQNLICIVYICLYQRYNIKAIYDMISWLASYRILIYKALYNVALYVVRCSLEFPHYTIPDRVEGQQLV